MHADGHYQAKTFRNALGEQMENAHDPFFLTPWDTAYWIDRVMERLRDKSKFVKRLIKRANKLYVMFGHGKIHGGESVRNKDLCNHSIF